VPATQQHVEERAQRVDVRGDGDRAAADLLGRGEGRREDVSAVAREGDGLAPRLPFEQLGDAEVEQLHLAVRADQHVRGLEVAVHDQVRVRVRHRGEHVQEQADARVHAQPVAVAVAVDVLSLDVLQQQVGLAHGRHAGVGEPCDVRVREARQDGSFAQEPFLADPAHEVGVEQLHRGAAPEPAVAALGQPDRAHPPPSDEGHEGVGADRLSRQRGRGRER
jgi:hypothetical protein